MCATLGSVTEAEAGYEEEIDSSRRVQGPRAGEGISSNVFPVIHPITYQIMRAKFKNEKERWGRTDAEVRCWTLQKDSRGRENEVPSRRASPVSIAQVL